MRFVRRTLPVLCLTVLLIGIPAHFCVSQAIPAQPAQTAAQPSSQSGPAPASTAAPAPPASAQAYSLPPDKLAQAIALGRISTALDMAGALWGLAVLWVLLATRRAAGLAAWTERRLHRRWLQGLLFFAVFLAVTALASLPLDAMGHAASRHFGISVQSWGSWLVDLAKGLGLSLLFGAPLLLFFNWIVRASPRRYWFWAWLVTLPMAVFTVFSAPLLDPVFNKFEPLELHHPALVARLETVVARTGTHIPPNRMFLMKASRKSNGLNAYVTGIGVTKRLVLWDTAVNRLPDDEILFIFGHESGHYVLRHIPKGIACMAVGTFFVFWACAGCAGWLAHRFGARWQLSDAQNETAPLASRPGFLVLLFVLSAASFLTQPVTNAVSRYFEHQADVYGQEAIHGLVADPQKTAVSAFNHLGEAWLEDPSPSPFVEFWEYNHPSVESRANFAARYNPWANGGQGRFVAK